MKNYFCGWYYKCQNETQTIAIIPAFHITDGERTCSIQIITDETSWTASYSDKDYKKEGKSIFIGDSRFDRSGLTLDIHTPELRVFGKLTFDGLTPIRYDIMGPFRYVPFMECRHSVYSMKHRVTGSLSVNGKTYDFTDGVGYMEGDRGSSFPEEYVWTQCCFPEGSVMLSVARIPFAGFTFTGVIGLIHWQGKEYRLATYLGAKAVRIDREEIVICQGKSRLTVKVLEESGSLLSAPVKGKMNRMIRESPSSKIRYRFERKGVRILEIEANNASFEYEYL